MSRWTRAELVRHLAHHGPLTTYDLVDITGGDREGITSALGALFDEGTLIRRKRAQRGHRGPDPYEYALAPPDGEWTRVAAEYERDDGEVDA